MPLSFPQRVRLRIGRFLASNKRHKHTTNTTITGGKNVQHVPFRKQYCYSISLLYWNPHHLLSTMTILQKDLKNKMIVLQNLQLSVVTSGWLRMFRTASSYYMRLDLYIHMKHSLSGVTRIIHTKLNQKISFIDLVSMKSAQNTKLFIHRG